MRRKGAVAIGYGLKNNCALKFLDVSWNGFSDDGAKSIGDALSANNTLTELDISSNRISIVGARWLAKGLAQNITLQILRVGQNPFQSEGAYEILKAVAKNKESAIEELYFDEIPVNAEFEELLEDVLDERANLSVQCGTAMRGKDRVKRMKKKVVSKQKDNKGALQVASAIFFYGYFLITENSQMRGKNSTVGYIRTRFLLRQYMAGLTRNADKLKNGF